jgi:hypothetical protein
VGRAGALATDRFTGFGAGLAACADGFALPAAGFAALAAGPWAFFGAGAGFTAALRG